MVKNSIVNEFLDLLYLDENYNEKDREKHYNMCMYYQTLSGVLDIDKFKEFLNKPTIRILLNDFDYEKAIIDKHSKYNYLFESLKHFIYDGNTLNKKYVCYEYIDYIDGLFNSNKESHLIEYKINNTYYSDVIKHLCITLYLYKDIHDFVEFINGFNIFLDNNENILNDLILNKNGNELCYILVDKFINYLDENPDFIEVKKGSYLLPIDFDISKEVFVIK